jgi:hypothetical protein
MRWDWAKLQIYGKTFPFAFSHQDAIIFPNQGWGMSRRNWKKLKKWYFIQQQLRARRALKALLMVNCPGYFTCQRRCS